MKIVDIRMRPGVLNLTLDAGFDVTVEVTVPITKAEVHRHSGVSLDFGGGKLFIWRDIRPSLALGRKANGGYDSALDISLTREQAADFWIKIAGDFPPSLDAVCPNGHGVLAESGPGVFRCETCASVHQEVAHVPA